MSLFKPSVNLGVNELWYNALRDYKPYEDRLRSTNAHKHDIDVVLQVKKQDFRLDTLLLKHKK